MFITKQLGDSAFYEDALKHIKDKICPSNPKYCQIGFSGHTSLVAKEHSVTLSQKTEVLTDIALYSLY